MLGVVLWSDASDRKAVIWCEDQGDLAFVSGRADGLDQDDFFDAGDLIQFDMHLRDATRFAHNPKLVIEQAGRGLPAALKSSVLRLNDVDSDRGEILPFARPVRETYHADAGTNSDGRRLSR